MKQKSGSPQLIRTPNEKKKHMLRQASMAVFSKKMRSKSEKTPKNQTESENDDEDQKNIKRNASEQIVIEISGTNPPDEEVPIATTENQTSKQPKKRGLVRLNTRNKRISIKTEKLKEEDINNINNTTENSTRDDGKPH